MARQFTGRTGGESDVEIRATALASEFHANHSRTSAEIRRLNEHLPSLRSLPEDVPDSFRLEYAESFLRAAYDRCGWKKALELLAAMPLEVLEERVWIANYLAGGGNEDNAPIFSRQELADKLKSFRDFLTGDREHLLATGLPSRVICGCQWIWSRLAKIYPVKRTEHQRPYDEPVSSAGALSSYKWVQVTQGVGFVRTPCMQVEADIANDLTQLNAVRLSAVKPQCVQVTQGIGVVRTPCVQAEADVVIGLTRLDAERLFGMRQQVLDMKLAVLREAESCLRSANADNLWSRCLPLFHNYLTGDEAEYLLRMDRVYLDVPDKWKGKDSLVAALLGYDGPIQPGGFTNIVELIGYVEKECIIGTMHRTRESLGELVVGDERGSRLWSESSWPYFELAFDRREIIDSATDIFRECDAREAPFWKQFHARVLATIETEMVREVAIRVRAKPSIAEQLLLNVKSYADWVKSHFESSGQLPVLTVRQPDISLVKEIQDRNIFRKWQGQWEIRFKTDATQHVPHSDGLLYMSALIEKPEKVFRAAELYALKHQHEGITKTRSSVSGGEFRAEQADDEGRSHGILNLATSVGDRMEPEGVAACRERLRDIEEEISEKGPGLSEPALCTLHEEREKINKELLASVGFNGARLQRSPEEKKFRDKVRNSIDRAITRISSRNSALARHLEDSMKSEPLFAYRPAEPTVWNF